MNFHISNLSPLRHHFSPNLGNPRKHHPAGTSHNHNHSHESARDPGHSGPVKIEVEPADAADDDEVVSGVCRAGAGEYDGGGDDTDSLSDVSADDVTQDSRDVLVQRLTDLTERLSGANVRTASIEALHRQVDEMERELRRSSSRDRSASRRSSRRRDSIQPGPRPRSLQLPSSSSGAGSGGEHPRGRDALGIMAPMSPSWLMSQFQRRPSVHSKEEAEGLHEPDMRKELSPRLHSNSDSLIQQPQPPDTGRLASGEVSSSASAPDISSEVVEDVVKEAEKLCAEMATVIESLQTRREESDVIPSLSSSIHAPPPSLQDEQYPSIITILTAVFLLSVKSPLSRHHCNY